MVFCSKLDKDKDGFINKSDAFSVFQTSGLNNQILSKIW